MKSSDSDFEGTFLQTTLCLPKCNIYTSPISTVRRHHRIMENYAANRK